MIIKGTTYETKELELCEFCESTARLAVCTRLINFFFGTLSPDGIVDVRADLCGTVHEARGEWTDL